MIITSVKFYTISFQLKKFRVMSSLAYTQTKLGKYEPKNAIASNLIKCVNCNQMISCETMKQHTQQHLKIKHFSAKNTFVYNSPVPSKKLNILSQFLQNYDDDIVVKSLQCLQLPKAEQSQRAQVSEINEKINGQLMKGFPTMKLSSQDDQTETQDGKQLNSFLQTSPIMTSFSSQLQIKKELIMNQQKVYMIKKKINFYESKNYNDQFQNNVHEDEAHFQKRVKEQQTKQNQNIQQFYNVEQYKENITPQVKVKGQNRQTFNFKKNPEFKFVKQKQKINTYSTTDGFYNMNKSQHQEIQKVDQYRFECQECKGFHCRSCGSDIPPIFRPVPDKNGQYSFTQQNIQFYRQYFRTKKRSFKSTCAQFD